METNEIEYKIKTAVENDIFAHLQECTDNFSPPLNKRVNIKEYSQKIFDKSMTFEAWKNQILVGLIAAYLNESSGRSVYITNVSVMKDFMGLGIASTLLSECIEYARKKNRKEIKLEVGKENIQAISLYRKFGFMNDDVKNDFLKMKMEIIK